MKIFISLITAFGLLLAGILAVIRGGGDNGDTPPPETEAPPIAASDGQSFTPPAMPLGPHDAESVVIAYNLSDVLEMPTTYRGVLAGQQSRIARLGGDLYLIYAVDENYPDITEDYGIYRYSAAQDKWTYLYKLRSHDVPGLHVVGGRVYVAYEYDRGLGVLEYDPATDRMTLQDSSIHWPRQNDGDHWSYMSTGISGGRYIWFLGCSNTGSHGKPGAFGIYSYDTVTRTFDTGDQPRWLIDYRHCYNYVLDNGDGGITIAGERDIFWHVSEWKQPEGAYDALFDEINFWTYEDNKLSNIHRVAKVSPNKICPEPVAAIYNGDAYVDIHGFLHILYTIMGTETGGRMELWHAVYKDGAELKKEFVLEGSQTSRFIEDTAGQLYLIIMPHGTRAVKLYKVNEEHDIVLSKELVIESEDSNAIPATLGMAVTAPRTGSAPSDFVDIIYPNMPPNWGWMYFRLQLR